MSYRRYTVEVQRSQWQTVTFVAEYTALDQERLDAIAVAHCKDTEWGDPSYRHGDISSQRVEVTTP